MYNTLIEGGAFEEVAAICGCDKSTKSRI